MYLALAATSSLKKLLAELAKLVKEVSMAWVTPRPVNSLKPKLVLEEEATKVCLSLMDADKAMAKKAQMRMTLFIVSYDM